MDDTLKGLIERNELTPSHVMKLLALGDRYLLSKYFHDDIHTNNIMWSDKLNDFRIIDWGIYLIIKPESTPSTTIKKINGVFQGNIILYASLYTQLKIEEGRDKVEQWRLKGAFIQSADFSDMDYASNEVGTVALTLQYDYAVLEF